MSRERARGGAALAALLSVTGYLVAAFLLRLPVLFDSVVDWDESLYLLLSDDILAGELPYGKTWDHKPPGIYYVFAVAQTLLGGGVLSVRLLGVVSAALGAFGVSRIHAWLWPGQPGALAGGLAYLILFTANGGLATNTEVVFCALTVLGVLAALRAAEEDRGAGAALALRLAAGFAFGVGFASKYVVGFDLIGFAALFAWVAARRRPDAVVRVYLATGLTMLAGFALALLAVSLPFLLTGRFGEVIEHSLLFNARYARLGIHGGAVLQGLNAWLAFAGAWIPVLALALPRSPLRVRAGSAGLLLALLFWLAADLASVVAQGRLFPHHFLQAVPPLALLYGWSAGALQSALASAPRPVSPRAALALLLGLLIVAGPMGELGWRSLRLLRNAVAGDLYRDDVPHQIAAAIRPELGPEDTIYVYNDQHVIYHLADARRPTRFPFALHLRHDVVGQALGFEPLDEITRILGTRPAFVIVREGERARKASSWEPVQRELARAYEPWLRIPRQVCRHTRPVDVVYRLEPVPGEDVVVYRRRDGAPMESP